MRASSPRVHCITNAVAQNFTANVLLAAGAVPSMTVAPEEVADFVARADALLINLGTFDRERREAVEVAIARATVERRPWVLDPVFIDRSPRRASLRQNAGRPRSRRPSASTAPNSRRWRKPQPRDAALERYALERHCVLALTGATDVLTDGTRIAKIVNGDPIMGRVTAMGCAGAAVVDGLSRGRSRCVDRDARRALLAFAVAGECAAARARGPGSFAVEMLDALAGLDRETLRARARIA